MSKTAYSPTGVLIVGTAETILGTALILEGSWRKEGEGVAFEWEGDTEVSWDSQETNLRDGQRVFVDEDGIEWLESELVLWDACKGQNLNG